MQAPATDTLDNSSPEERLRALGIQLPPAASAVGDYAPAIVTGNLLMTSGQLPWDCRRLEVKGQVRRGIVDRARLSGVPPERAQRHFADQEGARHPRSRAAIVRLEGTLGCAPGFTEQPSVTDGASHVVNEVFGPRGRHTRMVYSNHAMPMDCPTLVVLFAEVATQGEATRIAAQIPVSAPRCGRKRFADFTPLRSETERGGDRPKGGEGHVARRQLLRRRPFHRAVP